MTGDRKAQRIWHRDPRTAIALLRAKAGGDGLDAEDMSLLSWLMLTEERDLDGAERYARMALAGDSGDLRFAFSALAELLLRRGEYEEGVHVLQRANARRPNRWYELTIADALIEAGRSGEAEQLLEAALADDELNRHALKRLAQLALASGDRDETIRRFNDLIAIAPNYLVYASDYVTLARLQLDAGEREAARETLRKGAEIYARNADIAELREGEFGESVEAAPRVQQIAEQQSGTQRIPVRTPLISGRTGLLPLLDDATRDLRRPGDVIALAESPAAGGQGRLVPLELIEPGIAAKVLCQFVGKIGPLHSPEGMQGAIVECGLPRVLVGAVAGAFGKLIGRRGWFYRVTGPQAAMIDDVAACIPPFDHHMVYGPRDPDGLAGELADALGCPVAIVDANHKTGAWAVGASAGVDRGWVEASLADNPAGNEDEQTPVVILRRAEAEPSQREAPTSSSLA